MEPKAKQVRASRGFTGVLKRRYETKQVGVFRAYDMKSTSAKILVIVIALICIGMIAIALYPVFWVVMAGFKDIKEFTTGNKVIPAHFDFSGYIKSWNELKFAKYYINSGLIVAGGIVCAVVFNGLLAYALGVLKPPGHKFIFGLVMWTMLIPPTTSVVAQFVNIRNVSNFIAEILHISPRESILPIVPLWLICGANAFWLVLFKNFFEEIPIDYIEAARLDGCSDFGIFSKIILPLSRPIIMVVAIFAATAAWSDFLLPNLLLNNSKWATVMVRLFEFRTAIRTNNVAILRAVVFSLIPPIILFAAFQRQITNGVGAGGIKG